MSNTTITWAIRYTGIGAEPSDPLYITDMPDAGSTGYGYCCPCKETKRFPSEVAAIRYIYANGLSVKFHEAVDSVRGAREKAKRAKPTPKTSTWEVMT